MHLVFSADRVARSIGATSPCRFPTGSGSSRWFVHPARLTACSGSAGRCNVWGDAAYGACGRLGRGRCGGSLGRVRTSVTALAAAPVAGLVAALRCACLAPTRLTSMCAQHRRTRQRNVPVQTPVAAGVRRPFPMGYSACVCRPNNARKKTQKRTLPARRASCRRCPPRIEHRKTEPRPSRGTPDNAHVGWRSSRGG